MTRYKNQFMIISYLVTLKCCMSFAPPHPVTVVNKIHAYLKTIGILILYHISALAFVSTWHTNYN